MTARKPASQHKKKGRPPGVAPATAIRETLQKIGREKVTVTDKETGKVSRVSRYDLMLRTVYERAQGGTQWAVLFIADRLEGKPAQHIEQNIKNDLPAIKFSIVEPKKAADGG